MVYIVPRGKILLNESYVGNCAKKRFFTRDGSVFFEFIADDITDELLNKFFFEHLRGEVAIRYEELGPTGGYGFTFRGTRTDSEIDLCCDDWMGVHYIFSVAPESIAFFRQ